MLTVAKVTQGAAGDYAEYLEGKSQAAELGDYYLKDGERVEAPGRWAGGAVAVGGDADTQVTGDQLRSLMAVRRPDTREPLRRHGASGDAVAALDATFSAPKSVSAVWAVADPPLRAEIERAHERAVDRALEYSVERVAMIRQRVDQNTVIHAKPADVIATSWRHTTARAVEGHLPDPQLHSHVLLHGAVRKDGRVVAIDSRSWLVHRREVGAAYRTELARELNELGFEIQRGTSRGGRYFEIAGVPQSLIDQWSSRRRQVQTAIDQRLTDQRQVLEAIIAMGGPDTDAALERLDWLERTGMLHPTEERLMSATTRSAKAALSHRDLDEHWRSTGIGHQLDRDTLQQLRSARDLLLPAERGEVLEALTEFDATFPARDARAVALERSAGVPIANALEPLGELRDEKEILVLGDRTGTTREHRGRERATIAIAQRLTNTSVPEIPPAIVNRETQRLDRELGNRGGRLSNEQREAIKLACGTSPLVVIEGQAGTGKSTALVGVARAHQAAGRQIIVTSTGALAADRLARELQDAGVRTRPYSTAALQVGIVSGRVTLTNRTTVIHDEAALASTREQQQLLTAAEETGARLIEIGDPRQNQPVGAGGLWPHLEQAARHASAHVELTRNQRAKDPADRRDQALFRAGQYEQAIRGYAARNRVHLTTSQAHAEDHVLDAAHTDRRAGKTTIVIAQTSNVHLDQLNARAQAIHQQNDELGGESFPLLRRPYALHPGDEVQIRRTLPHPDYGMIRNGTGARITEVNPDGRTITLRLSDGRTVTLDREQADRADLRLAYVQHPFPAQGQTTDTAHLIIGEHTTSEGSYVAITRAREETHVHASINPDSAGDNDRLTIVSERMSHSEPDLPSINAPLAHESGLTTELDHSAAIDASQDGVAPGARPTGDDNTGAVIQTDRRRPDDGRAETEPNREALSDAESIEATAHPSDTTPDRRWPRRRQRDHEPSPSIEHPVDRGWDT